MRTSIFCLLALAFIANCLLLAPTHTVVGQTSRTPDGHLAYDFGIETLGGVFTPIIRKGVTIPHSVTQVFSTASDNQEQIFLSIFSGTAPVTSGANSLGQFQLVDIPRLPRGEPQIEVTFGVEIDSLWISAKDLRTERSISIRKVK
ncbi:Hsp70 family protein [Leptospira alstonii]|uniref:Hsp70 family protein n=1 Tax=Leptospira alstonii TaxID=28452 RepID=UPI00055E8565|nr:Hsp70 family protein [Leptospira alstonii]